MVTCKVIDYQMSERHLFQQVLHIMRTQPDLAWIFEAKRAAECRAKQFKLDSLPDSGIVVVTGEDVDKRLMFVSHVLEKKTKHLALCLAKDSQSLLPEFWCKQTTFDSMIAMRGHSYGKQLPRICLVMDFNKTVDKDFCRKMFYNCNYLNLLVIVFVPDGKLPYNYAANVDIVVRLGEWCDLTKIETMGEKRMLSYYISPYTIPLDRYHRSEETQLQIYKSANKSKCVENDGKSSI